MKLETTICRILLCQILIMVQIIWFGRVTKKVPNMRWFFISFSRSRRDIHHSGKKWVVIRGVPKCILSHIYLCCRRRPWSLISSFSGRGCSQSDLERDWVDSLVDWRLTHNSMKKWPPHLMRAKDEKFWLLLAGQPLIMREGIWHADKGSSVVLNKRFYIWKPNYAMGQNRARALAFREGVRPMKPHRLGVLIF